jgi:hypothetical protein
MGKYLVFLPDRIIVTSIDTKADCDRNLIVEADDLNLHPLQNGVGLEFLNVNSSIKETIAYFTPGHWTMLMELKTAQKIQDNAKEAQTVTK